MNSILLSICAAFRCWRLYAVAGVLAVSSLGLPQALRGVTLTDFGYQNMNVNGSLALGQRPLLVILVNFAGQVPLPQPVSFYDDLFFNPSLLPNVKGYFGAVSNGRFAYARGGVISLSLAAQETFVNFQTPTTAAFAGDTAYCSNIVSHAMVSVQSGQLDFGSFDANHDGHITPDELAIIIIVSDSGWTSGGSRLAGVVRPPGFSYDWGSAGRNVALLGYQVPLLVMCEETEETLGATDIYSGDCLSAGLTPQSCTVSSSFYNTYYLDPWHRMQLGWCEPRIRSLTAGGIDPIQAAQTFTPDAPIILYDPTRGTSEFFILEYRTQTSGGNPGYDANVAANGLAVWHVQQDANHNPISVLRVDAGTIPGQNQWRWCNKCQGLHYFFDPNHLAFGPCPAGGTHAYAGSVGYLVVLNNPAAPGQHGWNFCQKCQGLFYGPRQSLSHCPGGGIHDGSTSGDYSLVINDASAPGQHGWNYCNKCQGMFFGPNVATSHCPAGGTHDPATSGDYAMLKEGTDQVVWNEGPPNFQRGSSTLWGSDAITPPLRWLSGGTLTHLHVRSFTPGDSSIAVEWLSAEDTWVDFNYLGSTQDGSFFAPFKTFTQGRNAVSYGGVLHLKAGSSAETAPGITKPMTIQAYNGPATVGH